TRVCRERRLVLIEVRAGAIERLRDFLDVIGGGALAAFDALTAVSPEPLGKPAVVSRRGLVVRHGTAPRPLSRAGRWTVAYPNRDAACPARTGRICLPSRFQAGREFPGCRPRSAPTGRRARTLDSCD